MNTNLIHKIENLTARLLIIQDHFCAVLITFDREAQVTQIQNISGAISWANTSMYTLSLMRIQIMLYGTRSLAEMLPKDQTKMLTLEEMIEVIINTEKQVVEVEKKMKAIDQSIE